MQERSEHGSRWDQRRAETFERLLEAGERLFRLNGFDTTTVEEVAAAADVAKGTFFNYFPSKEALLGDVLQVRLLAVFERPTAPDCSLQDQIWELLVAARRELLPYLHLFRQMFSYAMSHPGPRMPGARGRTLAGAVEQLIREGQTVGVFRPAIDPAIAGALIATLFFRVSLMEYVHEECAVSAGPGIGGETSSSHGDPSFCWESQMRSGLQIIYGGLEGK